MNVGNKIGNRRSVHVAAPPGGRCSVQLGHEEAPPVVWDDVPVSGKDYISRRTEHVRSSCPFGVNQGVQHKNRAAIQAAADDRLKAAPFVNDTHTEKDAWDHQREQHASQRQHYHRGGSGATPFGTNADMKAPPATPSRRAGGYGGYGGDYNGRRPDTAGILTWDEPEAPSRPGSSVGRQRFPPGRGALQGSAW